MIKLGKYSLQADCVVYDAHRLIGKIGNVHRLPFRVLGIYTLPSLCIEAVMSGKLVADVVLTDRLARRDPIHKRRI